MLTSPPFCLEGVEGRALKRLFLLFERCSPLPWGFPRGETCALQPLAPLRPLAVPLCDQGSVVGVGGAFPSSLHPLCVHQAAPFRFPSRTVAAPTLLTASAADGMAAIRRGAAGPVEGRGWWGRPCFLVVGLATPRTQQAPLCALASPSGFCSASSSTGFSDWGLQGPQPPLFFLRERGGGIYTRWCSSKTRRTNSSFFAVVDALNVLLRGPLCGMAWPCPWWHATRTTNPHGLLSEGSGGRTTARPFLGRARQQNVRPACRSSVLMSLPPPCCVVRSPPVVPLCPIRGLHPFNPLQLRGGSDRPMWFPNIGEGGGDATRPAPSGGRATA